MIETKNRKSVTSFLDFFISKALIIVYK